MDRYCAGPVQQTIASIQCLNVPSGQSSSAWALPVSGGTCSQWNISYNTMVQPAADDDGKMDWHMHKPVLIHLTTPGMCCFLMGGNAFKTSMKSKYNMFMTNAKVS